MSYVLWCVVTVTVDLSIYIQDVHRLPDPSPLAVKFIAVRNRDFMPQLLPWV